MPALEDAIQFIRMGNREQGRQILEEILETDENNEEVWLWLSAVVEGDEDREICLENVLALNPNNAIARRGADAVQAGRFNANEMIGELLEQEEGGIESSDVDDLVTAPEEEIEETLELPSTMSKAKPKAKPKAKSKAGLGLGINLRLIVLLGLVLVIVLALGAVAVYSMLAGGDETPVVPGETPPVEQPGQEAVPAATDTPTSTPIPTETPTPTATRLQLPTPIPTRDPTPTATRVVSPTPVR